jgi:hypothetical protein
MEVHPMQGRALRRPFGQDYFTITDQGLLEDWQEQLDFFEYVAAAPTFDNIFVALKQLLQAEWSRFLGTVDHKARFSSTNPRIAHFIKRGEYTSLRNHVLAELDHWAADGFPGRCLAQAAVPSDLPSAIKKTPQTKQPSPVSMTFNGKWVQQCRDWAANGLPEEDSLFLVVSNLTIWFYFIEFHEILENDRVDKIVDLLTEFSLSKSNGYITRLNLGHKQDVIDHIKRIVDSAVRNVGAYGEQVFGRIRNKRKSGGYSKVYFLEQVLLKPPSRASSSITPSPSVVLTVCSPLLPSPSSSSYTTSPQNWVFVPDDSPLPPALKKAILRYYERNKLKMNAPTFTKLIRLINYLHSRGGEGRLSIKSLKKMGFTSHLSRQHIKNLEEMGVIETQGYCPVAGISKLYRLRKSALKMFIQPQPDTSSENAL